MAKGNDTPSLWRYLLARLRSGQSKHHSLKGSIRSLYLDLKDFVLESTPQRKRLRYGDIDFDCDMRVNTTAATVGWKSRLLGAIAGGPYQPCDVELFHQSIACLEIDFSQTTFIDIGSGKGRALLLASDYPFRRIIGVELVPELDHVARENISNYKSDSQKCFNLESVCIDATQFEFSPEPTLLFLFNPLPEVALKQVVENLERSMREHPRPVAVVYHNPLLMHLLHDSPLFEVVGGDVRAATFRGKIL